MATAKEIKDHESRAAQLRDSLRIAEKSVQRHADGLEKAKQWRDQSEQRLKDHLANAPRLTAKQARQRHG